MPANFNCPSCDRSALKSVPGESRYHCERCGETVDIVDAARDELETLADSDLSCSWVAERLLESEG
jgi:predicted nucleic acid-binding Zn ribbon protein